MNQAISQRDWITLVEILDAAINLLRGKNVDPVRLAILHFGNNASMFGLPALARVANKLDAFLIQHLTPDYEDEPASLLCFAMEGVRTKMKTLGYDQDFAASLEETVQFLEFFSEAENWPSHTGYTLTNDARVTVPARQAHPSESSPETPDEPVSLDHSLDLAGVEESPQSVQSSTETPGSEPLHPGDSTPRQLEMTFPGGAPAAPHATPPQGAEGALSAGEKRRTRQALQHMIEEAGRAAAAFKPEDQSADEVMAYKTLLKHDPRSLVFAMLADALCSQGRWAEAVEVCEQGLIFHPQHLRARVLLGWALWELKESREAFVVLSGAREEMEKNALVYLVLSKIVETEEPEKSREYREIYRKLQPAGGKPSIPEDVPAEPETAAMQSSTLLSFLSRLGAEFHDRKLLRQRGIDLLSARERQALMEAFRSAMN